MGYVVGVDGCPAGWFAVSSDNASHSPESLNFQIFETTTELLAQKWDVCAIDIPIGISERGDRQADRLARRVLSPLRHSSVFPVPPRPVLKAKNYLDACDISYSICGKKVSKQLFEILWRIREVDEALSANATIQNSIYEIHPEVSFWALNGHRPIPFRKRTKSGFDLRFELLSQQFDLSQLWQVRAKYPFQKDLADDDILDAVAALWSAKRIQNGDAKSFPSPPDVVANGIRSCIWY